MLLTLQINLEVQRRGRGAIDQAHLPDDPLIQNWIEIALDLECPKDYVQVYFS